MNFRNLYVRLLAALRCFDSDERRPMEDGPKGLGWGTIHDLEAAGLIEQSGEATSIRGQPFRTTDAGRVPLASPDPASGLPKMKRREPPEDPDAPYVPSGGSEAVHPRSGRAIAGRAATETRAPSKVRVRTDRLGYAPRGLGRIDAVRYVGVGVTKFDQMVVDRRVPRPKRIDGRRIWDRAAIDEAFENLPSEGDPDDGRTRPYF